MSVALVDAPPVLELERVVKRFPSGDTELSVLDGVSLTVAPGTLCALVGRSGSGKTTLLTIALGWERADRGEVRWNGAPTDMAMLPWRDVAVVPQGLGLLSELTIAENVRLPLRLDPGTTDASAADDLMAVLAIDHLAARYPSEVSLGEQQRTAVARALVLGPRLVLADEPVAHQNDEFVQATLDCFEGLTLDGGACLVATHNLDVLARMTKVFELHGGHLTELDAPRRLSAAGSVVTPLVLDVGVDVEPGGRPDEEPDDSIWAPPS